MGRPNNCANGLPGKREEPMRAGIMAIVFMVAEKWLAEYVDRIKRTEHFMLLVCRFIDMLRTYCKK